MGATAEVVPDEALAPAQRGEGGSPLNLSAEEVPELADMAVGDTVSFKIVNATDDGVFELAVAAPGEMDQEAAFDESLGGALGVEDTEVQPLDDEEPVNIEGAF